MAEPVLKSLVKNLTSYDLGLAEGLRLGREEAKRQLIETGNSEGMLLALRKLAHAFWEDRFQSINAKIEEMTADQLRDFVFKLSRAASQDELLPL